MAAHSTTQLANGHTLTIVERRIRDGLGVPAERVGKPYFAVEDRNELGTYIGTTFAASTVGDCEAWVQRAAERSRSGRPMVEGVGERREAAGSRRRAMLGDDHSASRRVDVLAVEAPHLLAAPPRELRIVVDVESDPPRLVGEYSHTDEDTVFAFGTDGRIARGCPVDCVRIVKVEV